MSTDPKFLYTVHQLCQVDSRFSPPAYGLVRDALEFTIKSRPTQKQKDPHVAGPELLQGFRQYCIQQFGPLAFLVLKEWGITCSEDVGSIVFNLINSGWFGKSEEDCIEDFIDGIDLEAALQLPFSPQANS